MERYFNTAGPNRPKEQYTIDPLSRLDLDDVLMLIRPSARRSTLYSMPPARRAKPHAC